MIRFAEVQAVRGASRTAEHADGEAARELEADGVDIDDGGDRARA